jgi:hypothetical protein
VTPLIEGFGHFVTSMPAPTASGWSDVAGRVSHPLESAALSRRTPECAYTEARPAPGQKFPQFAERDVLAI